MADTSDGRFPLPEPTEIAAGALQLRIWDPAWLPARCQALDDDEIRQWFSVSVGELEDRAAWAAGWIERAASWQEAAVWAVCDATSGEVLGNVALNHLDARNASGEAGYWVLPQARGRGVGRRALAAAAGFGFGALDLVRIELYHAVDNPASCAVATAAGFLLEGTCRQSFRYGDGRLHDEHLHARLASDPDAR